MLLSVLIWHGMIHACYFPWREFAPIQFQTIRVYVEEMGILQVILTSSYPPPPKKKQDN